MNYKIKTDEYQYDKNQLIKELLTTNSLHAKRALNIFLLFLSSHHTYNLNSPFSGRLS